ncbi:class I SAM-dependent DNA methyltransferase [Pseudoalteromonas sp. C8]|uniref:class I SAM-dependent DNA methyltransferase n=1 Tax=Pseudoalteromonas sp. C8 TaxID=2686345 RepID=UPI0013FE4604|nr:class I SAM-dependent DNA methyltransferase [Pseudoalteromonas sp. C8]
MAITYTEVQENLAALSKNIKPESYIYDLLLCFGTAKASITRLKKKFETTAEITSNGQLLFKEGSGNLEQILNDSLSLKSLKKNKIRFVIVTDYKTIFAHDIKSSDTIEIGIDELHYEFEYFLPLAGMERASLATESVADAKAAEKMAKLFDLLKVDNEIQTEEQIHSMNVFLSRVLFCFFAEDTGIFQKDQFTKTIGSLSQENGSDVHDVLKELFDILNTTDRDNCSNNFKTFPYVNGGLFADDLVIPKFTVRSRRALIESGSLDWSQINPDIFGSMIQAVMDTKKRSEMGMHYTSVQNIMKVLSPLFLDKLTEEYLKILGSDVKDTTKISNLKALCTRLSKIKVGDMACGSGNFLIIAFKELRKLEMTILKEVRRLEGSGGQINLLLGAPNSGISLGQFYGIEYDDFASGIAELSLWLVEHQMNQEFNDEFGANEATLPLKSYNNIVHGNALRIDWNSVMPNEGEVFLVGNPPFLGARLQNSEQKNDIELVCSEIIGANNLDYVSCWFVKAKQYITKSKAECALVSTNSINQGDSVSILWPTLLDNDVEIGFAHKPFKWENNAKGKAAVICVIVSLRNKNSEKKYLFESVLRREVKNINAYLIPAENIFVAAEKKPLNGLPPASFGSMANDGGHLILSSEEREEVIEGSDHVSKYIKKLIGSNELIKGLTRWCIWVDKEEYEIAKKNVFLNDRFQNVHNYRSQSKRAATNKLSNIPYAFGENRHRMATQLVIPRVSSENRKYIPMGFFDENSIAADSCTVCFNPEVYVFTLLSSRLHTLWVATVGGRLKSDYRYSNTLCYNTFPVPDFTEDEIAQLEQYANMLIRERVIDGQSLSVQYSPKTMPERLKTLHEEIDSFVENIYLKSANITKKLTMDSDRLEVLFNLYKLSKEAI